MNLRPSPLAASLVALAAVALHSADARACGGCFHEQSPPTPAAITVVTGHRMAFAVSPTHAVLWDQVKYAGSPAEFAWVLPVKAGAVLQLSTDAWFETLDAATSPQITAPQVNCPGVSFPNGGPNPRGCGIGCGAGSAVDFAGGTGGTGGGPFPPAPPPVTVTHEGTVGPYQTVTLHANVPNALPDWLTANKYAVDPSVKPIIDAYAAEGFDFIALRLQPGQGIQAMKPVRVVTPGMSLSLPLRMVAAGTGPSVAITLFVIGEGRWEVQNFFNGSVNANQLTWDFNASSSNYSAARQALLAQNSGRTWNDAFAQPGGLLAPVVGRPGGIIVGQQSAPTLAAAYVAQGVQNGETTSTDCLSAFTAFATSADKVVPCSLTQGGTGGAGGGTDGGTGNDGGTGGGGTGGAGAGGAGAGGSGPMGEGGGAPCGSLPAGQIDAHQLACGALDDIAVALEGLHPRDVWLSRLEANLPRAELATDLTLEAAANQSGLANTFTPAKSKNACPGGATGIGALGGGPRNAELRNRLALLATLFAALGALARRRRRGPVLARARQLTS